MSRQYISLLLRGKRNNPRLMEEIRSMLCKELAELETWAGMTPTDGIDTDSRQSSEPDTVDFLMSQKSNKEPDMNG